MIPTAVHQHLPPALKCVHLPVPTNQDFHLHPTPPRQSRMCCLSPWRVSSGCFMQVEPTMCGPGGPACFSERSVFCAHPLCGLWSVLHAFPWLRNVPRGVYARSSPIHSAVDTCTAPTFGCCEQCFYLQSCTRIYSSSCFQFFQIHSVSPKCVL